MNFDCDCQCEADYGVFGDMVCTCGMRTSYVPKRDPAREKQIEREREKRRRADEQSRSFNSYMIELFNERRRRP